jgi:protein disulfide isomerase
MAPSTRVRALSACLIASAVALACLLLAPALAAAKTPEEHVLELTDDTIDAVLRQNPVVFVMFHAPWCARSKAVLPLFAVSAMSETSVVWGRLDVTTQKKAALKFEITALPTLRLFRNGKSYADYDGGRSSIEITKYATAMRHAAVRAFPSKAMYDDFLGSSQDPFVICVDTVSSPACATFDEAADRSRGRHVQFIALARPELVDECGLAPYRGSILLVRREEPRFVVITKTKTVEEMLAEIQAQALPLVGALDANSYRDYAGVRLPMLYVFVSDSGISKAADKAALNAVRQVAGQFRGRLSFVHVDASKYAGLPHRIGLSGDKFPAIAIDHAGTSYTMPAATEITAPAVQAFVEGFLAGRATRTVRSERAPAQGHTVDGLTTVVGSTFGQVVGSAEHDVFIQFYAPWCGFCKEMAPALGEVAKKLENEDVVIARFDATSNDFDKARFPLSGYPTLFFVKKGEPQTPPEEYTGGRTTEEMLAYLRTKLDL